MKLNIYGKKGNKKIIVKTYEAESYDMLFGIVDDVSALINIDDLKDLSEDSLIKAAAKVVTTSMGSIKELMHDIFDGITDEELRHASVKEIAQVIVDVFTYTFTEIGKGISEKNQKSR